ncbi:MAG TPA: cysteine desulfurase-like protein [Candidatus Sulfomarinibacteraceae bacterium]|nr:cysteine desulfurase-like protein [Candidatus Sulfomarinibacteraceae bacterium]
MTKSFDPLHWRQQFPALQRRVDGRPALYLDGPGGTQVAEPVIAAMADYARRGGSNLSGPFASSDFSEAVVQAAREAVADLYNAARPEEIVFGQNMTSLTFAMSRALARTWQPGDEIVVTHLDHDANISPWLLAAEEREVTVRWLDFRPQDGTLVLDDLAGLLNEHTRLVAVTHASNALGTIPDVARVASLAREAGALTYVDAVHFAPHNLIDVKALDCDFLVSSAYKYFGPHTGVLYGKHEHLQRLQAYKVRPAPSQPPEKWETGTQSFESLAGVTAAVDYLASIGARGDVEDQTNVSRRRLLERAMARIKAYEAALSERFLRGAAALPGLRVYGVTDIERLDERAPTFALSVEGHSPAQAAQALGRQGIFVWDGHYYALAVMERLGLLEQGGLVRVGFVHYNTPQEVDDVLEALAAL